MNLFQINWRDPATGFQKNTILRSLLYTLNMPVHTHLFNLVGTELGTTFVFIDYDLCRISDPRMQFILIDSVDSPRDRFLIVGRPVDYKFIEKMYDFDICRDSLSMKDLAASPFGKMPTNFHRTYKSVSLEVDVRKISTVKSLSKKEIAVSVSPAVSLSAFTKKLKIKDWVVTV